MKNPNKCQWTCEVPKLTQIKCCEPGKSLNSPKPDPKSSKGLGQTWLDPYNHQSSFHAHMQIQRRKSYRNPNPIIQFISSNPGMQRCSKHTCLGVINSGGLRPLEDQTSPHSINSIDFLKSMVNQRRKIHIVSSFVFSHFSNMNTYEER